MFDKSKLNYGFTVSYDIPIMLVNSTSLPATLFIYNLDVSRDNLKFFYRILCGLWYFYLSFVLFQMVVTNVSSYKMRLKILQWILC